MTSNQHLFNSLDTVEDVYKTINDLELPNLLTQISKKIVEYRIEHDMTQRELADKLEVTQAMISRLESGEYNPSIGFLFKITKKLGIKFELEIG